MGGDQTGSTPPSVVLGTLSHQYSTSTKLVPSGVEDDGSVIGGGLGEERSEGYGETGRRREKSEEIFLGATLSLIRKSKKQIKKLAEGPNLCCTNYGVPFQEMPSTKILLVKSSYNILFSFISVIKKYIIIYNISSVDNVDIAFFRGDENIVDSIIIQYFKTRGGKNFGFAYSWQHGFCLLLCFYPSIKKSFSHSIA